MDLARKFNQTAVFWNPELARDVYGQDTYETGIDVACRWQDKVEEFVNAQGERELSAAVVYMEAPVAVARVDSWAYLGEVADLSAEELADPTTVSGALVVRAIGQSPTLDAGTTLYKLWLGRG